MTGFRLLLLSLFLFLVSLLTAQNDAWKSARPSHFPTPPATQNRLFFLQRNLNTNTVVYDLNLLPSGEIDATNPLDVFYIAYALNGERRELKWVERKFAYGYSADFQKDSETFEITLVAYGKRKIHLKKSPTGYLPMMNIAGRKAILTHLFIQADESGLWPEVQFIEIFGKDSQTGAVIFEKIEG